MIVPLLLDSVEVKVHVQYHLFFFADSEADEDPPLDPREHGNWFGASEAGVCFESDEDVVSALMRFESWDGEAAIDSEQWSQTAEVTLAMTSGSISIMEIAGGALNDVFALPAPGRYRVRLGWREGPLHPPGSDEPESFALAQFWPTPRG
ncbi:hypothetical protein ACFV0L_39030 [Streptosporangium canum]|uniref:hypothetical protein n=1 Tax=Streptosporangiaceae TaxID=2004 RepID=UPI0033CC90A7